MSENDKTNPNQPTGVLPAARSRTAAEAPTITVAHKSGDGFPERAPDPSHSDQAAPMAEVPPAEHSTGPHTNLNTDPEPGSASESTSGPLDGSPPDDSMTGSLPQSPADMMAANVEMPSETAGTQSRIDIIKQKVKETIHTGKIQLHHIRNKYVKKVNRKNLQESIQNFDPQAAAEWVTKTLQKKGTAFYGTLATVTLSTYFVADLTSLVVGEYIPDPPVVRVSRTGGGGFARLKSINDYNNIFSRNLFNSAGLIPGEDIVPAGANDLGGAPVKSTLPLNLIGTIIMNNELRSIATIEDKSASIVYPVRVEDEIPDKIRVVSIEAKKVIFVNKSSGRREYIEIPEDGTAVPRMNAARSAGGGIEKVAPTQFNVSRTEVDKALADFNNILTQARAVPNFENGAPAGYKLFQIVPGSIYDKLGLINGDVISGLNGESINDPAKAFEMLNELKKSNHLELQVKKDGKVVTYTYDIH